jgi:hypothetical protein
MCSQQAEHNKCKKADKGAFWETWQTYRNGSEYNNKAYPSHILNNGTILNVTLFEYICHDIYYLEGWVGLTRRLTRSLLQETSHSELHLSPW